MRKEERDLYNQNSIDFFEKCKRYLNSKKN